MPEEGREDIMQRKRPMGGQGGGDFYLVVKIQITSTWQSTCKFTKKINSSSSKSANEWKGKKSIKDIYVKKIGTELVKNFHVYTLYIMQYMS